MVKHLDTFTVYDWGSNKQTQFSSSGRPNAMSKESSEIAPTVSRSRTNRPISTAPKTERPPA